MMVCHPLTPERWADLEKLFGARGGCGGCWCMTWRLKRADFERGKGEGNRLALRALAESGRPPGILGYLDGEPVAWCSVAPRAEFRYLRNARTLKPIDAEPVWSVTCLLVRKDRRRQGLSTEMLRAASEFVRAQGGRVVEGYPAEPKMARMPDVFAWTGVTAAFRKAGFQEHPSESKSRRLMRLRVAP